MFGKKVLIERMRNLDEKVQELDSQLKSKTSLAKFLLNHKKEDVVVSITYTDILLSRPIYGLKAQYVYENEIKDVFIHLGYNTHILESVENINDKVSVVKVKNIDGDSKYYYLDKGSNSIFEVTEFANHLTNIGKKIEEKPSKIADKETKTSKSEEKAKENNKKTETKVYDKNGIKYKDTQYSVLMQYYTKYNLNVDIRDFKPIKRMGRKEAATLLYLFDKYKYVSEIIKHIGLSRATVVAYAYALRKNGYLIYDHEVGRVANGCLIYKKGV